MCHHVHQEPHLGVLHLPSSVLHMQSSNICKSNTGVCYISHQVYCRGLAVLQEPDWVYLHLPSCTVETIMYSTSGAPSSVQHILSCKSGASLGELYLPTGVLHMPSCTSGASLGCTAFAIKCATYAII